jgi:hypothetical protein
MSLSGFVFSRSFSLFKRGLRVAAIAADGVRSNTSTIVAIAPFIQATTRLIGIPTLAGGASAAYYLADENLK